MSEIQQLLNRLKIEIDSLAKESGELAKRANASNKQGNLSEAKELLDQVQEKEQEIHSKKDEIKKTLGGLVEEIKKEINQEIPTDSQEVIESCLDFLNEASNDQTSRLIRLGKEYESSGQSDLASQVLQQQKQSARELRNFQASIYSALGNYERKIKTWEKYIEENTDPYFLSTGFINKGDAERYLMRYPQAEKSYTSAKDICSRYTSGERLKGKLESDYLNYCNECRGTAYLRLGYLYAQSSNPAYDINSAIKSFSEALSIFKEVDANGINCSHQIAEAHLNLGSAYSAIKKYNEAENEIQRARQGFDRIGNLGQKAEALNRLGNLHFNQGNLSEAKSKYLECIEVCDEISYPQGTVAARINLGNIYFIDEKEIDEKEYEQALEHYEKSLNANSGQDLPLLISATLRSFEACIEWFNRTKDENDYAKLVKILKMPEHALHSANYIYERIKDVNREKALDLQHKKTDVCRNLSKILQEWGIKLFNSGDLRKSIEKLKEAILYLDKVKPLEPLDEKNRIDINNFLRSVQDKLLQSVRMSGDLQTSLKLCQEILEDCHRRGDFIGAGRFLTYLGDLLFCSGKYGNLDMDTPLKEDFRLKFAEPDNASEAYQYAIQVFDSSKELESSAAIEKESQYIICKVGLSKILTMMGKIDEATRIIEALEKGYKAENIT